MPTEELMLAVHGGAGRIEETLSEQYRQGIREALSSGWAILQQGGTALDACQECVLRMEDNPIFNAGLGSRLNRDGEVELDAVVMNGDNLSAGAVAGIKRVRNPVSLARLVMERSEHVFLVGNGAEEFARAEGFELCDPRELVADSERSRWLDWRRLRNAEASEQGTVGAVAKDNHGGLAAATSTGGVIGKHPGRVGDSPILGCGCYADNLLGAASATGDGEAILKVGLSRTALDLIASEGHPQQAGEQALGRMAARISGQGGLILLDPKGRVGIAHTTPDMSAGFVGSQSGDFHVQLRQGSPGGP